VYLPGAAFTAATKLRASVAGKSRPYQQHVGGDAVAGDGGEVSLHHIGCALHQRAEGDRPDRGGEHGVAIRCRFGDDVGADLPAGAGLVLRHHILAEPLGQHLRHQPALQIGGLAGRPGDDHARAAAWPSNGRAGLGIGGAAGTGRGGGEQHGSAAHSSVLPR
jgi:hypothetical protein